MDSCYRPRRKSNVVSVTINVRVGANGLPSCSRTGSGSSVAEAFDDARWMVFRGLRVQEAPEGEQVVVIASKQNVRVPVGRGSARTLKRAMEVARGSLLAAKNTPSDNQIRGA